MRGSNPSADSTGDGAARCPFCGGTDTERDHPKGPSLCRSIHYCDACEESFQAMR